MLTPTTQYSFLEKLYTSPCGEQFRVVFLVHLVNGELKGRIVSVRAVSRGRTSVVAVLPASPALQKVSANSSIPCLPVFHAQKEIETIYFPSLSAIVSPYIELYFFNSQPTRAPSHR